MVLSISQRRLSQGPPAPSRACESREVVIQVLKDHVDRPSVLVLGVGLQSGRGRRERRRVCDYKRGRNQHL